MKMGWAAVIVTTACGTSATAQVARISSRVDGSMLSVSVNPSVHAGAIDSLTFRGVEYVDNYDHGRQIQTALQVDNLGECYNPTEAGSKADAAAGKSSSLIRLASSRGNVLKTETRAAFWLAPRETYEKSCSPFRRDSVAENTQVRSDYTIGRTTRFYGAAIPNLLLIDVTINFPEQRNTASIEALTGYMPRQFTSFYSYDPRRQRLQHLRAASAEGDTNVPVIVATPDGQNAMGVFSKEIGVPRRDRAYYAYFYFPGAAATAKWSCVFSEPYIRAGTTLSYSCPIAVGTLEEVTAAFDAYARANGRK